MSDTIPSPEKLNAFLDDILDAIDGEQRIRDWWAWLYPNAHATSKRGATERLSGGGERDVSDDVVATDRFRQKLRHAAREVATARNRLLGALADLNDAATLLDPAQTAPDQFEKSLPHPANQGDLRRARDAQNRRRGRAEESGDWSEVTG